jgi:hypothetical protein
MEGRTSFEYVQRADWWDSNVGEDRRGRMAFVSICRELNWRFEGRILLPICVLGVEGGKAFQFLNVMGGMTYHAVRARTLSWFGSVSDIVQ